MISNLENPVNPENLVSDRHFQQLLNPKNPINRGSEIIKTFRNLTFYFSLSYEKFY